MRQAFITTLLAVAAREPRIMLLTGDLGFMVFEPFQDRFPDRFINVGVAEQNLVSVATGLGLTGYIPVAYSIATFATMRPFEQIRNDMALHNAHVILVGTGAGLSYATASNTHHAIEDIALMRTIPNMTVLCPGDPVETVWATKTALSIKGPVYLRIGKTNDPVVHSGSPQFRLGKGSIVKNGHGPVLLATGNMVPSALLAATMLEKRGLSPTVVSMHTIKPLDTNLIKRLAKTAPLLVTIEEHLISGGLGSAVAETLASLPSHPPLLRLGIFDHFIHTIGSHAYLRSAVGISSKDIAASIYTTSKKRRP